MSDADIQQADQLQGAKHPRHTHKLFGQDEAQSDFLTAYNSNRMHHAWMITGPKGIGKATLAWRIARFVLSKSLDDTLPQTLHSKTLEVSENQPISRRIGALGEPNLYLVRRTWDDKTKKIKQNISVNEIRKLKSFFNMSAADGGWRVAIIDSADEMNSAAANALLKILEEPPEKVLLFLISHQPLRLLPTIRSRCRSLRCKTLMPDHLSSALDQSGFKLNIKAAEISILADGSVGTSIELISNDGMNLYNSIIQMVGQAPQMDRQAMQLMADACSGRNAVEKYNMTLQLFLGFIARLAKFGALQPKDFQEASPGEALTMSRLAPNTQAARKWANLVQEITDRTTHARSVNLDPSSVILDMLLKFEETAQY